ncbi:MAG: hypothetical protein JOY98_14315 [Candidatus Eremiobacteraeota bacterium]|nr:hypothetical protein [Candidatus Eremiobacteraeota bacterium]
MKFYRYALVFARTSPVAFWAAAAGCATLAIVALTGIGYLLSGAPPYGFYYDLGVDILATSTIAHWLAHPVDLKDALGWAGWGDRSAFAFAPMTSVAISVLFAKLFAGDAVEAVKGVQVLQVLLSAGSAFTLYRCLRGNSPWAWVAAAIYALAPEQLLMIRGDLSFGFAAALAPLALAIPLVLVRRWGMAGLPMCAVLASLLSAYFTIEHLFLQGIPAYVLAVVLAYDRERIGRWALVSLGGFVVLFASIAYVVLPTQASTALFSPSATVGAALGSGEFTHYQNGPLALASLTTNELIANPRKEFSLGPLLFLTVPFGLALWALALAWIVTAIRTRAAAWGELPLAIVAGACTVLSAGALVPGVGLVWWIVSQLPVLDNIRTPDRFIAFGVVAAVVFAVSQLERMAQRPRVAAAWIAAGLCVAGLAGFFVFRTFLGDTLSLEDREPFLGTVNGVAQSRDNRIANLALVDKGSIFDTSLYGAPMPFLDFQGDFAERYEGDGLGGTGLLARGNVATVIASPPWTPDSPLFGQSQIASSSLLVPVAGDATTVSAYAVEPVRGYVRAVSPACLSGGPGLLDHLVALSALSATALDVAAPSCARTVYADAAPLAAEAGGAIAYRWPALSLFPHAGVMRDIDYRLAMGRFLINYAWYRNSVDGDATVFGPAALSLDPGYQTSSVFEIGKDAPYAFAMRAVCHGTARGRLQVDRVTHAFTCKAAAGFQWVAIALGRLKPGLHGMSLVLDTIDEPGGALASTWRFAFDGAAIVQRTAPVSQSPPAAYVFSAKRFSQASDRRVPGALTFVQSSGLDPIGPARGNGFTPLLSRASNASATYRWNGPSGRYRIWASAYAESQEQATSYVAIAVDGRCCAGVATSGSGHGTTMVAYGDAVLHDGSAIRVLVHGEADEAAIAQLLDVAVDPDPFPATLSEDRSRAYADFDFLGRMRHVAPQIPTFGVPAPPGRADMERFNGLPVSAPLRLHVTFPAGTASSPTTLYVGGDFSSGPLRVRLQCGDAAIEGSFLASSGDLALPPGPSGDCTVTLQSVWATLYLQDVTVSRSVDRYDAAARRWLSAGRYHMYLVGRGGNTAGGRLTVDGRLASQQVTIARDGVHDLRWSGATAGAYAIAFVPVSWPSAPATPRVEQTASARWRVSLERAGALEAAVFPDGYWQLAGNGRTLDGHRCDLENTCFDDVQPGTYVLFHRWPSYITLGFAVTLLAWIFAAATLYAARKNA